MFTFCLSFKSDEAFCNYVDHCPEDRHACPDHSGCVSLERLCDGVHDCRDRSDEDRSVCKVRLDDKMVNLTSAAVRSRCEGRKQFSCENGACVSWERVCDGLDDCGDFSDEYSCGGNECGHPNTCAHVCVDSNEVGFECRCHVGYVPRPDDPTQCDDVDECLDVPRPCSQRCINTPGSYKCLCSPGYVSSIDDPAHCKADSEMPVRVLFSNRYYIQLAALNGTSDIIVHNQSNAVAIDFDWQSKCLFWSDVTSRGSSLRKVCGWIVNFDETVSQTLQKTG